MSLSSFDSKSYEKFFSQVYGGEARISALRNLFPRMEGKNSLASSEERALIKGKASLLAAVDYYVSMQSDVFISASPGNMHNALVSYLCLLKEMRYRSRNRDFTAASE